MAQLKEGSIIKKSTGDEIIATLADVDIGLELKADKQQEAWITPTLLGGATGVVAYLKDELGFVHLKGRVNSAVDVLTMFVMPSGYRPDRNSDFIVFSSGNAKRVRINSSGNVDNSDSQVFVELSSVIYKAER